MKKRTVMQVAVAASVLLAGCSGKAADVAVGSAPSTTLPPATTSIPGTTAAPGTTAPSAESTNSSVLAAGAKRSKDSKLAERALLQSTDLPAGQRMDSSFEAPLSLDIVCSAPPPNIDLLKAMPSRPGASDGEGSIGELLWGESIYFYDRADDAKAIDALLADPKMLPCLQDAVARELRMPSSTGAAQAVVMSYPLAPVGDAVMAFDVSYPPPTYSRRGTTAPTTAVPLSSWYHDVLVLIRSDRAYLVLQFDTQGAIAPDQVQGIAGAAVTKFAKVTAGS